VTEAVPNFTSVISYRAADMVRFYVLISNRYIDIDSISKHN